MDTVLTNWGEAVITSIGTALALFAAAIPRIIGFVVILIVGWIVAAILDRSVTAILRAVRFDELASRSGLSGFFQRMGLETTASTVLGDAVKWFIRLIVLVVAFDALGLPAVSEVLQQLLLWLPNLVVALVVLIITGLIANFIGDLVRGATAQGQLGNPDMLETIARTAIWGFGIIISVNQLGIADTLFNILFMGFVATVTLAFGLAFGLGGREVAGEIARNWYSQVQEVQPEIERATQIAKQRVDSETN